jgi:segregation and condensation protein A
LPEAPVEALAVSLLVEALDRLAAVPEPEAPPPEVVAREITIGMQIRVLLAALAEQGKVVLQSILATCRSRTEAAVTMLAALELVRRRQVRAEQDTVFGPILLEPLPGGKAPGPASVPGMRPSAHGGQP